MGDLSPNSAGTNSAGPHSADGFAAIQTTFAVLLTAGNASAAADPGAREMCIKDHGPGDLIRGKQGAMLVDRDSLLRKLHELRSEHRDLDTVIARLAEQGAVDQLHLQRLKKRKLMLRDEIGWLESRLIPDNIA